MSSKRKTNPGKDKIEPKVEVIILHHDGLEIIKNCLESLKKNTYQNLKVTIVNQDCSDGSEELIKKNYKWINLVVKANNDSFAKANNDFLKKSEAKYCILLNDDTEQEPNWISEMVNIAEKDKKISSLQPKVLSLRNKEFFEYAGAAGGYIDKYGYPLCQGRVFETLEKDNGQYEKITQTFWSCGVAIMLNMEALHKVGYLDEDYGSYGEEIDLCWRMNLAGYKQIYVPKSRIYHLGSGTWNKRKYILKKEFLTHRNHILMLVKNYSSKTLISVLPGKLVLEAMAFFIFLFKKPYISYGVLSSLAHLSLHPGMLIKKHTENKKIRILKDKEIMKMMVNRSAVFQYYLQNKKTFKDYTKYMKFDKNEN